LRGRIGSGARKSERQRSEFQDRTSHREHFALELWPRTGAAAFYFGGENDRSPLKKGLMASREGSSNRAGAQTSPREFYLLFA
jgi:hypothetical protein